MNEQTKEVYLAHYGIKGQKWGVRNYQNEDGTLTEAGKSRYAKEAAKDAKEYARAKAYYGEGAGNRRKKIKNLISQKMKDPAYKAEFERQLSMQNMEKHQKAANFERHTRDTAAETKRIIKTVASVGITAFSLAALANPQIRVKAGELINKYGQKAYNAIKTGAQNAKRAAYKAGDAVKRTAGKHKTLDDILKGARVVK